ncbi:DUF4124 domain-containing protein [Luteimonas sp. S4-F44]|uniref:DUF4124 domain-containing protein n=1 Tax=Luteimonas sp. S4-F44 TaxID=2925842 RepID=UPI001F53C230|nr:DUF4124 domain-containing protein [Luteimonas sp. S4-F44]UNK41861.1 DUF4124 domain-containing protein [Luteimonas sp. S4-F44]
MTRGLLTAVALLLSAVAADTAAADTVIYRCTDADGAVTFQNGRPCAPGQQQQRRVVEIAAPLPAYIPPARPAPAATPPQAPRTPPDVAAEPPAVRAPLPPLYACRSYDGTIDWREDATPPTRCRPLQTVGIGGLPGLGAGQACERVEDSCEAVAADALCDAWQARLHEAEFRWRYADSASSPALRQAFERMRATWDGSACAADAP